MPQRWRAARALAVGVAHALVEAGAARAPPAEGRMCRSRPAAMGSSAAAAAIVALPWRPRIAVVAMARIGQWRLGCKVARPRGGYGGLDLERSGDGTRIWWRQHIDVQRARRGLSTSFLFFLFF